MTLNTPKSESNSPLREKLGRILGIGTLLLTTGCQDCSREGVTDQDAIPVPSTSASVAPSASALPTASATASAKRVQVNGCLVKGNITDDGRKIYHVAGGCPDYAKTKINKPGERCFSSETEARAAGWQKSSNCK